MKKVVLSLVFVLSVAVTSTFAEDCYSNCNTSGGGGGIVFGSAGQSLNWSTYIAPTVNVGSHQTVGQVLGATSTAVNCPKLITKYGFPVVSHSDVIKLQQFLNKYENAGLAESGKYDSKTYAAVKAYQTKYNITPKSGLQLVKTTKVINAQYCSYKGQGK